MDGRRFDNESAAGRDEIDLGGVAAAIGRSRRLILRSTVLAGAAALIFCLSSTPRYLAESRILIENQESYFTSSAPEGARDPEAPQALDAEAVNSQIQLLTSRDLARKAVQKLGLKGNPEFDPEASFLAALMRPLALLGLGQSRGDGEPDDRLINKFIDHLTVLSPTKTRVLQIEFTSRDPDLAARAANTVAELFIDMKSQAKREDAHQASAALKPLIVSLETRVAEAENKVEAFRARTGLYENSANSSLPTQQLGEIATRLAEARAQQSESQAKANGLRSLLKQGRLADASDVSANDLVRRIAEQRVAVRSQLAVESRTLLPAHPRIKELEAQLADLDAQLRAAVEKAARGFDNDAQVAATRVANLTALLEDQKTVVGASNADASQLRELQRDEKILKDQLATLSAKYQAALARDAADSAPADARIISRALAPSQPVFPKTVPISIFATLAGLFFSTAFVVARELMGDGRRAPLVEAESSEGAPRRGREPIHDQEPAERDEPNEDIPPAPHETPATPPAAAKAAIEEPAATPARDEESFFGRIRQAVAEFAAPAAPLAEDEPSAPAPAEPRAEAKAPAKFGDKLADKPADMPAEKGSAPAEDDSLFLEWPPQPVSQPSEGARAATARRASPALVERIVAARSGGGAKVLVVSDAASMASCASLALSRALSREGRAILVQIDSADKALAQALERADGAEAYGEPQPGLAQLLQGEASFAEAIYRDGASRLHIIQSGGAFDDDLGDLDLILDALQSTYDFVLVASGENGEAARLCADADLTLIFADDGRARDFLHDDFAALGARAIVLAGMDSLGEIVEMAA
jgi:polysaccharide biosynthesis transport protein